MFWKKKNNEDEDHKSKKPKTESHIRKKKRQMQSSYVTSNASNVFLKLARWFRSLSIIKHILVFYLLITIIGALILYMPMSQQNGVKVGFIDSLFTSASAFSDTGLVTQTTALTWSYFGQAIIAILILIGGIGWFALKVFFINYLFNRPIGMLTRRALSAERGSSVVGDTKKLIQFSVSCILVTIAVSAVVMSVYFYCSPGQFQHTPWTVNSIVVENDGQSGFLVSHDESAIHLTDQTAIRKDIIKHIYSWQDALDTLQVVGGKKDGLYHFMYPHEPMQHDDRVNIVNQLQAISDGTNTSHPDVKSELKDYTDAIFKIRAKNVDILNSVDNSAFDPYHDWGMSIRYGIFHSISAINNAGFDILSQNSLAPYYHNYFIQIWIILLFVMGGIGYPVLFDVSRWVMAKVRHEHNFRWSLFTKISCITYLLISALGLSFTFGLELSAESVSSHPTFWDNVKSGGYGTTGDGVMALIFNTLSTRNAGFATINTYDYTTTTMIIHSIMMFIGSAPSSTAGGIRTTTFAIILMGIWSRIKNKSSTRAFNRRIPNEIVIRSYIVFVVGIILVIIGTTVATTSFNAFGGDMHEFSNRYTDIYSRDHYPAYSFTHLFFEVASAFGTTGLSTGLTGSLNTGSKLFMIIIMFVGQLGVSSTILVWGNKREKSRHYKYIDEDILIG